MHLNCTIICTSILKSKSIHIWLERAALEANHCKISQCTSQNLQQRTCRTRNTHRIGNMLCIWNLRHKTSTNNSNMQLTQVRGSGKLSIEHVELLSWQTPGRCRENSQMGASSHYKYHKFLQHIWKFFGHLICKGASVRAKRLNL